jgi:hypothetical protein
MIALALTSPLLRLAPMLARQRTEEAGCPPRRAAPTPSAVRPGRTERSAREARAGRAAAHAVVVS